MPDKTRDEMLEELSVNKCEIYDGDEDEETIEEYSEYLLNLSPEELVREYNEVFDYRNN